MKLSFNKIAIVNRGEPAMRLIHAVREINQEHQLQLETVAIFTESDRQSMFVREADHRISIGEATCIDPKDNERKSSYLDYRRLERALKESKADAVWVGWGFVAEHAEFVDLCDRMGLIFIGPSGDVMRKMGDKIASKKLAESANVPVAPWSGGKLETLDDALRESKKLGYPVILKASAGGGGRGIRRVRSEADLKDAFVSAKSEALKAFGDDTLFVEEMVEGARHVEVQIIGDQQGTVWAVGVRDCTVQRRNQKVVEEAPCPVLSAEEDNTIREAAIRLAKAASYVNAGTVECLFDPKTRRFFFMEMNTRLQVEHPVTEEVTGLDLVKLQLQVASGLPLVGTPPQTVGCAIEVRLNAEDPDNNFAPAPGKIELFNLPTGPGIRIDTGVGQGDQVSPDFDSMIAKFIAYGRSRDEALGRLRRALLESAIVIRGGTSNKAFLLEILGHQDLITNNNDIGWLDKLNEERQTSLRPKAEIAILRAAIAVYEAEHQIEKSRFFAGASRGRPLVQPESGHQVDLAYAGENYKLNVFKLGNSIYRIAVDDTLLDMTLDMSGAYSGYLTCQNKRYRVISIADGPTHLIEVDGIPHRISQDEGGMVRAPAPAVVLSIASKVGQEVEQGEKLLVLEAMKMEMAIFAPFSGKIREIEVLANQQVDAGAALVMIEPKNDGDQKQAGERISFPTSNQTSRDPKLRCADLMLDLKRALLGYDLPQTQIKQIRSQRSEICDAIQATDKNLWWDENSAIEILADLLSIFRRESDDNDAITAEEYLQSYLRSIESGSETLSDSFLADLERALTHYGVESLERSDDLETALLFLHKARAHLDRNVELVFGILERRLSHAEELLSLATTQFKGLLDRLIEETHGRYLPLNDLARTLRHNFYDKIFFDEARAEFYKKADKDLAGLLERNLSDDPTKRKEELKGLVDCPQPIISYLSESYTKGGKMRKLAVEIMLRRYYRIRNLEYIKHQQAEGFDIASAEWKKDNHKGHVTCIACGINDLSKAIDAIAPITKTIPTTDECAIDIYTSADEINSIESLERKISQTLSNARPKLPLSCRICVAVVKPKNLKTIRYFTYLKTEMGFTEQEILRGIHPMLAERLELWRLENFETKQLRVSDDIYLFHVTAKDNPKDERLIAFVEVRDITPVLAQDGTIKEIPGLERLYLEALADIRDFQSKRTKRERLHWNRVVLYVRPETPFELKTLQSLAKRLAPAAKHLGLEKVVTQLNIKDPENGSVERKVLHASTRSGTGLEMRIRDLSDRSISTLTPYAQRVVSMRRFGMIYPYEIIRMLTVPRDDAHAEFPSGKFIEYDLDETNTLVPVDRQPGQNKANVIIGIIENYTEKYPEGLKRVICLGDGSRSMGALAEPECRRINQALDLAEKLNIPFEWFAVSSGAKISMDVGTEGLDWIARVIRRIVEFTQAGNEINIIIPGVNVGGQSYWNAEATMMMHTKGILIMTPEASMVLTGKKALDYSGGVSADDNQGIGGVERIMGFNGQAQYAARDIAHACHILLDYYNHSYIYPGEQWPRRRPSKDPVERDICLTEHPIVEGIDFKTIGEVFSVETNPGRKKPFDIRAVMQATIDSDAKPLERWSMMRLAETAVVWDTHLGGIPITMIGIESRPIQRVGFVPGDGPETWTGGTLFPRSSKKVARAINSASHNRPVVVLANLSGFDGSPESMRELQLEYGAEIGRAVVNFNGPIVFCVISRYHGGAYVVFSQTLNDNLKSAALEGSYASVIGGAPAAAVVFPRDVKTRVNADQRIIDARNALKEAANDVDRNRLRRELAKVEAVVFAEKQGEVADYFDSVHNVQRAKDVGSLTDIVPPMRLRPWLVESLESAIKKLS